jgi:hypothetical protein
MDESSPTNAPSQDTETELTQDTTASPDDNPQPAEVSPPLNRAARRGKGRGHDTVHGVERSAGGRARSAQGRRFNPIRRTG